MTKYLSNLIKNYGPTVLEIAPIIYLLPEFTLEVGNFEKLTSSFPVPKSHVILSS